MNIKVVVAYHKPCIYIKDDVYLPIQAGAEGNQTLGIQPDNQGINISQKNSYLNEMTVLYWAWKNLDSDYIGLAHYRRFFTTKCFIAKLFCRNKIDLIARKSDYEVLLNSCDIILPSKRKYYIETIESHFKHLPYTINEDLDILRDVINNHFAEYSQAFESVMNRNWGHMFNMLLMSKQKLDEYCTWAFDVLEECDRRIEWVGREPIQARMYISEFLLDTWIETRKYRYCEMNVIYTEKQNWFMKIGRFVVRKIYN